eukprot:GHRR01016718.1.p2 GENE.GHRR01016718.1~~GHRR01016718.1.p2  ORF type:complete len:112 (-),score=37.06 GHRR01016718.1:1598-1933(-)
MRLAGKHMHTSPRKNCQRTVAVCTHGAVYTGIMHHGMAHTLPVTIGQMTVLPSVPPAAVSTLHDPNPMPLLGSMACISLEWTESTSNADALHQGKMRLQYNAMKHKSKQQQ